MSKFFFGKSDSESESASSEEEVHQKPVAKTFIALSDDDEETVRVVKSSKDKRFEEIQNVIKNLKNHKKIKDMSNVLNDFEALTKAFDKSKKIIDKDGIPQFYIRCLVELEDFVNEHWDDLEGRKALSKNNSKGLTALRQKLKKYIKLFEEKIAAYRENPDLAIAVEEEEEAANESADSEEEVVVKKSTAKDETQKKTGQDSDSDSDMWGGASESESSSSDEDIKPLGQLDANYFRKKVPVDGESEVKKKKEKEKKVTTRSRVKDHREKSDGEEDDADGGWKKVSDTNTIVPLLEKPQIFGPDVEIKHEVVVKKLNELMSGRGKKGTDRSVQIDLLIELRDIALAHDLGDPIDCKILFSIVAAIFDYNSSIASNMRSDVWIKCLKYIKELLSKLMKNKNIIIVGENIPDDMENFTSDNPPYSLRGCMLTIVERMDDEFTKMLQACDAHSTEYIDRLKDEATVCTIIEDTENYLKACSADDDYLCRIYLKHIQHIYYKFDAKSQGQDSKTTDGTSSRAVMDRLCRFIYTKDQRDMRDSKERLRAKATLSHIYFHALHDRYYEARDLMLMSHLQDDVLRNDVPTQILYNRAMVQLGICAFRQGMIADAHSCLVDIQSSRRAKELLAQGLLPLSQYERTPEQEKIEKRRQMPYHMHINLELLECVYLVAAMLLEIPYMAAHEFDACKPMISKNFHYVLRISDKQTLIGPPESMREHVVAACKAMKNADWKACHGFIINPKMNAKVWDLFYNTEDVRNMLRQKIKEESLRTFLFAYSSIYDSISIDHLANMFQLQQTVVHSIVSKMVIKEELMASLDEPTQTVVMHQTEPTVIQSLALQLSEKLSQVVEHNEKLMDMKMLGPSYFNNYQQRPNQGNQQSSNYQQRDQQQSNYTGRRQMQRGGGNSNRY